MEEGKCVTSNDKYSIYQPKKKNNNDKYSMSKNLFKKTMLKLCNIQCNV